MTDFAIDTIGALFDPPEAEVEAEDSAPVQMDGWHVNVTPEALEALPQLAPFVVTPTRLRRVWAGDDPVSPILTVALRFADEAEGRPFFPAEPAGA